MRNYIFGVNINGQRRRIFVQASSFRDACEVLKNLTHDFGLLDDFSGTKGL